MKKSNKRGIIAMLFVTVLAIVVALSARMLKGSETTYAAATSTKCNYPYSTKVGNICLQSKVARDYNGTCNLDGTFSAVKTKITPPAGFERADQNAYLKDIDEYKVRYYASKSSLAAAGAVDTRQTDSYIDPGELCRNIIEWRKPTKPVTITIGFKFVKIKDPEAFTPAGSLTKDQCLKQASQDRGGTYDTGAVTHCMQYDCKNGTCTPTTLTTSTKSVYCKNGNTNKYSYREEGAFAGTCRKLKPEGASLEGRFYCTEVFHYDCNYTSDSKPYEEAPKATISSSYNKCKLEVTEEKPESNGTKYYEVKHCSYSVCSGGVWQSAETPTAGESQGCPDGYVREDYSDGTLAGYSGECKKNGVVNTSGSCVDGSINACIAYHHYKCVSKNAAANGKDLLSTVNPSDVEVSGIPDSIKVGDTFSIQVKLPFEDYNQHNIIATSDVGQTYLNQVFNNVKNSSDPSITSISMEAFKVPKDGKATITLEAKANDGTRKKLYSKEIEIVGLREDDDQIAKDVPECKIQILDKTPKVAWTKVKYLQVKITNEVPLTNSNAVYWSDGVTQSTRAVNSYQDYSVTVRGENGKVGTCEIAKEDLGKIDTNPPVISNVNVNSNGQLTFTADDGKTNSSGLAYWYLGTPEKTLQIEMDENGVSTPSIQTFFEGKVTTDKNVNGNEFTCANSSKCETRQSITSAGTYYLYVVDAAGNLSMKKVSVMLNGSPLIDSMYAKLDSGEEPQALLETQKYGTVMRLSNTYQTRSMMTQMAFKFNQTQTEYDITTTSPTITLYATLKSSDKSFVKGFEPPANYKLTEGNNRIIIKVQNNKGKVTTYTINVMREDTRSGVNLLENLTVGSTALDFNENRSDYYVDVLKDVTSIPISANLKSYSSKFVPGYGPRLVDITSEETVAELRVQSEAGAVRSYKIHFRQVDKLSEDDKEAGTAVGEAPSSASKPVTTVKGSNYLSSLAIIGTNLTFSKDRLNYNVYVPYTVTYATIYAFAEDPRANVTINTPDSLQVGSNTATVSVTSTNKQSRTYTITIIRKEDELGISSNTKLGSLEVLGYDIGFDRNKTNYELKINKEKNLFIAATPESDRSEVYIIGNEDLTTFSTVKLSVIAEDGSEDVYSVQISKDVWNVRNEIMITVVGLAVVIGVTVIYQVRRKKKLKKLNVD